MQRVVVKSGIFKILFLLLIALISIFSYRAYSEAKVYENKSKQIVKSLHLKELATMKLKDLAQDISMGLYKNGDKKRFEELKSSSKQSEKRALLFARIALGLLFVFAFGFVFADASTFTLFAGVVAAIMLVAGIFSPLMMLTIHKEISFVGDVVISFESKSILSSIHALYKKGEMAIATVIVLFSVAIPMLKVLLLTLVPFFKSHKMASGIVRLFKMLGKWSMIDVFVVALMLVYFSMDRGEISRAQMEVGVYFFLGYVMISMLMSISANRVLDER